MTARAREALLVTAAQLEAQAAVLRELAAAPEPATKPAPAREEWLTPAEAAKALGVSRSTLTRLTAGKSFVRRPSPRVIRFERSGFERWRRQQRAA